MKQKENIFYNFAQASLEQGVGEVSESIIDSFGWHFSIVWARATFAGAKIFEHQFFEQPQRLQSMKYCQIMIFDHNYCQWN